MGEFPNDNPDFLDPGQDISAQVFRRLAGYARELPTQHHLAFIDLENGVLLEDSQPTVDQDPSVPCTTFEWLTREDDNGVQRYAHALLLEESGLAIFNTQIQISISVGQERTIDGNQFYGDERRLVYKLTGDNTFVTRFVSTENELPWKAATEEDLYLLLSAVEQAQQLPDDFEIA